MTIQELMEKRAKVWEAAKNFVDTHENENGVLSAEDGATSVSYTHLTLPTIYSV